MLRVPFPHSSSRGRTQQSAAVAFCSELVVSEQPQSETLLIFIFLSSLVAAVANQCSVLPLFLLCFSPLFPPLLLLRGDSKKVDIKSNSCCDPGTESRQRLGDLDKAGKINKIHIYFGVLSAPFV